VNDHSESSSKHTMIIFQDLLGYLGMIINIIDKTVTCDTDAISLKDKGQGILIFQESWIDVYSSENEMSTQR
jgi:hypothetical protein